MSLKTSCPSCGATFAMKSRDLEGKKIKCKKCDSPFVVSFGEDGGGGGGGVSMATLPPRVQGVKPKKKKSKTDDGAAAAKKASGSGNKKAIIIASCLAGGILLWTGIMFALSSGESGSSRKEPEVVNLEFTRGESEQRKFAVEYPAEWSFRTGGGSGGKPEFIRITTDNISISIKTTLKASALGDIAGAGGVVEDDLPDELKPIAQVHEQLKNDMAIDMNSYEEEPPEVIHTKFGESRMSKFAGDRGFLGGGKAFGFRATVPCRPDMIVVTCTCDSKKVLDRYEETLRKIILSIGS
jgi:predicted Zn finger-like uncharacterized protein